MPAPPSKLVIGTLEASPRAGGLLLPFGERDDPQRLAVLLAEHLTKKLPDDHKVRSLADACLAPNASWKDRRHALGRALAHAAERQAEHFVTLVDIDALAPQGVDGWGDDPSIRMRRDLYRTVLDAIDRGGWLVLRPCPSREAAGELADLGIAEEIAPDSASVAHLKEASLFGPEVRPLAARLVQSGALRPRDLSRIVEDESDFDEHLIRLAYAALPPAARDAGKLLSAVRPPQHVNGALGPFAYSDGPPSATSMPRAATEALREAGFLQPGPEPSTLRMPRLVRGLLRRHAGEMKGEVWRLHRRLAEETFETGDISAQLEVHHHAVSAGDIELAKRTARYYGTELRDLATGLSLKGGLERKHAKHARAAELFAKAAELFDYVVKNFDRADAYSWEYLGYNLACANAAANAPRILEAYERAHQLLPDNPLYHGRLLGFRGQMGHDVRDEFARGFDRYVAQKYGDEAVSLFAEATLKGLRRGQQGEQVAQIVGQKRALLERFAPRVLEALRAAEPPETGPREPLFALRDDIEERSNELWEAAAADRVALRPEIDRLRAKAASIIRARADAALGPLERAHESAVAEARRLLGR